MRLIRFVGKTFSISLQRQVAYRTDLVFQGMMALVNTASGVLALGAVFYHIDELAGWRFEQTLILLGNYYLITGIREMFIDPNLDWFSVKVRNGELDNLLLQPAPSLFVVSFSVCQPWALSQIALGIGVGLSGIILSAESITLLGGLAFLYLVPIGVILAWASRVLLASLSFWAPGLELQVIYSSFWALGRYPVNIYSGAFRLVLTYVIPVAFIATIPVRVLTEDGAPGLLLGGTVAAIFLGSVASAVWASGLRRYTSATS